MELIGKTSCHFIQVGILQSCVQVYYSESQPVCKV